MAESILDYEKRPIRYNAIDGVDEMLLGLLFLALFLLMHLVAIAPAGSVWHWKPALLIANALVFVLFLVSRKLLKQRITYRRTGYVKPRYSKVRAAVGGIVGMVVGGVVTIYVLKALRPPQREPIMLVLNGLLWAGFYLYFYIIKTQLYRAYRYVIASAIAIAPILVYSAFSKVRDISTLSQAVLGACFLISGVITFWSYLRNTKPADEHCSDDTQ